MEKKPLKKYKIVFSINMMIGWWWYVNCFNYMFSTFGGIQSTSFKITETFKYLQLNIIFYTAIYKIYTYIFTYIQYVLQLQVKNKKILEKCNINY